MAIQSAGFWVYVTLADHGDNRVTKSYQTDPAIVIDYATAVAQASALVTDLQAVTKSVITGYRVEEVFYEDSISLPVAGVENEDKASITYSIDGTNKKGNLRIPAPVDSGANNIMVGLSGASANQVNTQATTLQAYADNFRTAGGFLISDGEKLNQVLVGKRISAKNNNG